MSFDPTAIDWNWNTPQQDQLMPDNINWGNVFGQVGDAVTNGVNFINNNPGKVYAPPPPQFPTWVGNSDAPQEEHGEYDRGFGIPLPYSPNDYQYNATPNNDFGRITPVGGEYSKYNSYWLDGPPLPPDPSSDPWSVIQQGGLWRGTGGYQYNDPGQMYQQGQETPQYAQPNLPPVPFGQSW